MFSGGCFLRQLSVVSHPRPLLVIAHLWFKIWLKQSGWLVLGCLQPERFWRITLGFFHFTYHNGSLLLYLIAYYPSESPLKKVHRPCFKTKICFNWLWVIFASCGFGSHESVKGVLVNDSLLLLCICLFRTKWDFWTFIWRSHTGFVFQM